MTDVPLTDSEISGLQNVNLPVEATVARHCLRRALRRIEQDRAEIARLRDIVAYAAHRFECGEDGSGEGCTCGLDAALARLKGK